MRRKSLLKAIVGIIVVAVLAVSVPTAAAYIARYVEHLLDLGDPRNHLLTWLYIQHFFQLALALCVIALLKRMAPADYGLHMPRGKSYIGAALVWGGAFGILMTLVDYAPQFLSHTKPMLDYPLTPRNVLGWLFFEGIYVGPTEEVPFRAMLVPFLAAMWPARLRLGRFEMNWAGVIVAVFFALLHATNFATRNWQLALGQQVYAFTLAVLYAYWLEKSESVLPAIVGHNAGDVVEYALLYLWVGH